MGLSTGIIRYNLNDRGRQYLGQPRKFNITKMQAIVNGDVVQEMVKKGDLVGYLGHDIRRQFGLNPPETALQNGQLIPIDPAFVTTYIHIKDDGTVEHEARFLDTPLGKVAQEWHLAKTGGFSSVVAPDERNPEMFWGFDYVRSPNFHGNRGYAVMDDIRYKAQLSSLTNKQRLQEVEARRAEQVAVMDALMQTTQKLQQGNADLSKLNQQLSSTVESLSGQLKETERQLHDLKVCYDNLQPKFAPVLKLGVANKNNWIVRSLEDLDNIASFDSTELMNGDTNKKDPLRFLKY